MSTSGTTGDPTLVPEKWGGGGGAADDHHPRLLGHGRAPRRLRRARAVHVPRPDVRAVPGRSARCRSCSTSTRPRWSASASCRCATGRPRSTTSARVLINAVRDVVRRRGFDPRDVFSSYKGVVFAGEPLSPRARALAESGASSCSSTRSVGDVTARVRVSRARRPALLGGHRVRRGPRSRRHRAGRRRRTRASWSRRRCSTAPRRWSATAPTTSCALTRDAVRVRPHPRADLADRPQGRRGRRRRTRRCCPSTCGPRSSRSTRARWGCSRSSGRRARSTRCGCGSATRRRGETRLDAVRDDVRGAVLAAIGVEPEVELVPERRAAAARAAAQDPAGGAVDDARPATDCWGVGCYDDGRRPRAVGDLARRDPARHRRRGRACSRELGVGAGTRVLFCSMLSEAGQFWPSSSAPMLAGAQLSCADATEGEAVRVAMFTAAHRLRRGARRDRARSSTASTRSVTPYGDVFGGVARARRASRARTAAARPPGSRPHHFVLCGPAVAIGARARRARRSSNAPSGSSTTDDGRVVVTQSRSRAPRRSCARRPRCAARSSTAASFRRPE